jgi:hypothetical protein
MHQNDLVGVIQALSVEASACVVGFKYPFFIPGALEFKTDFRRE